jgi:hypothetical protein
MKLTATITEILLKMALNTINLHVSNEIIKIQELNIRAPDKFKRKEGVFTAHFSK